MVSDSTTCFGRFTSLGSPIAPLLPGVCGGTISRSCTPGEALAHVSRRQLRQAQAGRWRQAAGRTSSIRELMRSRRCFSTVLWLICGFSVGLLSAPFDGALLEGAACEP